MENTSQQYSTIEKLKEAIDTSKPAKPAKPTETITQIQNTDVEKVTIIEEPKPKIAIQEINKSNWHLALSYSGIEGNGLQVLLNSLAEYQNNQLVIRYLPKVEHFLTENLNASMIQYLQDYFNETNLTIILKPKEELIKTPKDRKIKRHEDDIEIFCKELTENLCVAKLQSELGAVIDEQTIDVKSKDY